MKAEQLMEMAVEAMSRSYSPYSGYRVGAALLCGDGRVFCGANIENAAFSATVCAERSAFFAAIAAGERDFCAIAVVGGREGDVPSAAPPCGVCRQVMAEFCRSDFVIFLKNDRGGIDQYTLGQMLPLSFGPKSLG